MWKECKVVLLVTIIITVSIVVFAKDSQQERQDYPHKMK